MLAAVPGWQESETTMELWLDTQSSVVQGFFVCSEPGDDQHSWPNNRDHCGAKKEGVSGLYAIDAILIVKLLKSYGRGRRFVKMAHHHQCLSPRNYQLFRH